MMLMKKRKCAGSKGSPFKKKKSGCGGAGGDTNKDKMNPNNR